ncbi:MAG: Pimeloyl-ACP methyl ester carboxylesterase [Frankiales bacterium]|nr:Pimeloyl-ACP methyl ester carboxylesterase [Frankiales bacterium]
MSRRSALLGVGAVAAGTAVVVARRRAAARGVDNPLPETTPAAPPVDAGRRRTVLTADGVELAVTEHGSEQPGATVVLAHGYVQSSALWAGQVRDLVEARSDLKVVTYDHRGHGASGRATRETATIEQLARDLAEVLAAVAPTGPVVLGGHSMGGMTIMALAEQFPDLFEDRITGVAFVATSSGGLSEVTWGLPAPVAKLAHRLLPAVNAKAVRDEAKGKPRRVSPAEALLVFPRGADPAHVKLALDVQRECRAETVAHFLATFSTHDRLHALKALADLPTVVIVGEQDRLTPLAHSRALAEALSSSELVVYPGVGHMVQLERRAEVSRHLLALIDRALVDRPPVV